jgi:hypothetical protein
VSLSAPVEVVRRLGVAPRIGATVMAEHVVDAYRAGCDRPDGRTIALDILLRDPARRVA